MDPSPDFLERTRQLREALKKRANEIESGVLSNTSNDILDAQIQKNIQSSLEFCKSKPSTLGNSVSMEHLLLSKKKKNESEKKIRELDPFRLPEIKNSVLPYLKKPSDFPLPRFKKVLRYRINFTGIEPKIKKLNVAYSRLAGTSPKF